MKVKDIKKLKYTIIIEPDENGFHGYVPALSGLHAGGRTEKETLKYVKEAIISHIQSYIEHNDPIPGELAEGYRVNAKLNLQICEDFKFSDSENV